MPGKKERKSGSPGKGEPDFLAAGKIRRPHGVHGELVVELYTDFPERMHPGTQVYIGEEHVPLTITGSRIHNEGLLIAFSGITNPENAGNYRNQILYTSGKHLPGLSKGEYYFHQLIGLQVFNEDGKLLGELTEIMETGANDVYVVNPPEGKEILLPAIPDVILKINLEEKKIHVHLLPGLIDDLA